VIDYEDDFREALEGGALTVPARWEGFPGQAFGGFIAGAVLMAVSAETEQPRPLSLFARYHRPVPIEERVALSIHADRRGRSIDTFSARLHVADRDLASFSIAFGHDGGAPLESQATPAAPRLREPRALADHLLEIGMEPAPIMRRTRFRGEPDDFVEADGTWHLRAQWPAPTCEDLAVRAAVALMPIDNFVGPATIRANGVNINQMWPVAMPSVDCTAWFYAPEAPPADVDAECSAGWLTSQTSVPVSHAGYAVGRTQVWSGERLTAEGISQVLLLPPPPS